MNSFQSFSINFDTFWLKDQKWQLYSWLKEANSIEKDKIYQIFQLNLIFSTDQSIFDLFWSLLNFSTKSRHNIIDFCREHLDSDDKFGSKKPIKWRFESNYSQNLGLNRFNCLSLVATHIHPYFHDVMFVFFYFIIIVLRYSSSQSQIFCQLATLLLH